MAMQSFSDGSKTTCREVDTTGAEPSSQQSELIRIENLHKTYFLEKIHVPVLKGVSFTICQGEMVALMGASGSGKTTLMNILGCLDRPTSGEYWLDGQLMSELSPDERALHRASKIGFVFQSFNLLPRTTALNNVLMPTHYAAHNLSHIEFKRRALELLAHFGLDERINHEPSQLSGGQQQRVAITRSLINLPEVILADEPTGNLDSHTGLEILKTFQQLNAAGLTIIIVTHDPKVASFAHRTIHLSDGLVERDTSASDDSPTIPVGARVDPVGMACRDVEASPDGRGAPTKCGFPSEGQTRLSRSGLLGTTSYPMTSDYLVGHLPQASNKNGEIRSVGRAIGKSRSAIMSTTFRTAATALRRNKMRSGLTALGIVIGIAAVIAMVEIGQGTSYAIQQSIASLGANMVQVDPNGVSVRGVNTGAGGKSSLNPADCDAIIRECTSVRWAAPSVDCKQQVIYGSRNWSPRNILGTTTAYLQIRNWPVDEGEPFTDGDVVRAACVCLIGQTPARELFQGEFPIGKTVRVKNISLKVVGVLSRKGANMLGVDQDDLIIAPLTTVKYKLSGIRNINVPAANTGPAPNQANTLNQLYPTQQLLLYPPPTALQMADTPQMTRFFDLDDIWISAISPQDVSQVMSEITPLLRARHRQRDGDPDDFRVRDITEISQNAASTSRLMTSLLICVAVISLMVGGVGIMNIMLVSVTERTREIGLRMAVGARAGAILWQFLIEAVLLCLAGGITGIVLGRGTSLLINSLLHWPTMPSLVAVVAAVAVSITVGIIFGYYPAWKASRLDPIEALRYE
jgi:macrolide transport system ATP-binding/permease protein